MYYYEKDYIMRLIHGIALALARMLFGEEISEDGKGGLVAEASCRTESDYFRRMIDQGQINDAEEKLFDLIETSAWADRQKAALVLDFYEYVNGKDDDFLAAADFSREEVYSGLEDALKLLGLEIPEYLRL